MNTIGSHPGAILFRLSLMIILIGIMMVAFFSYLDETQKELERASIIQTKKIIDSALAVVFATHAVNGRLSELNKLDGGNPFEFLQEFKITPPAYQGEINSDLSIESEPGWYYLKHRGQVAYKPYYSDNEIYYAVILNYQDKNVSGRFEPKVDKFKNLNFTRIEGPSNGLL